MTDIVERLRELHLFAAQQKSRDWDEQDEIRDLFKYTFNAAYEAAAEIERLRAALREIIKLDDEWKPETLDDYSGTTYEHCGNIARAALGEKE